MGLTERNTVSNDQTINFGIMRVDTSADADRIQSEGRNFGVLIVSETGERRTGNSKR